MRKRPVKRPLQGPWPFPMSVGASGRTTIWVDPGAQEQPERVKVRKPKPKAPKKLRKRLTKRLHDG